MGASIEGRGRLKLGFRRSAFAAVLILAVFCVGLLTPRAMAARGSEETLKTGIAAYEEGDFARAIDLLKEAVGEGTRVSAERQALAYMYLGSIYTARGLSRDARAAFEACIAADLGFAPNEEVFRPDWIQALEAVRAEKTGILRATSEPVGAEVYLDGKRAGVTPYEGRTFAGVHELRLDLPGYRQTTRSVDVGGPGRATDLGRIVLERKGARLEVAVFPPEAKVSINGAAPESPSGARVIPEGRIIIEALLDGYSAPPETLQVADGDVRNVTLRMTETPDHVRWRRDQELQTRAGEIRASKARNKTLVSVLSIAGSAGGFVAAAALNSKAKSSLDAYKAAVDPAEMDSNYSGYESRLSQSRVALGAGVVFLGLGVFNLTRHVPTIERIKSDLLKEKGPSGVIRMTPEGDMRVGLALKW